MIVIAAAVVLFGSFSRGLLGFIKDITDAWNVRCETQITQFAAQASGFDRCVFFSVSLAALGILFGYLFSVKRSLVVCSAVFALMELLSLLRVQLGIFVSAYMGGYLFLTWLSVSTSRSGFKHYCRGMAGRSHIYSVQRGFLIV
jgi:hypothetical protein